MKPFVYKKIAVITLLSAFVLSSCYLETEDPGPIQETERDYAIEDFDRLEMGSAFNITVEQGDHFEVIARGDRRNIDDLIVRKDGSTLIIKYDDWHNRLHTTYVTITMPSLSSVNFSGASESRVSGFENLPSLDIYLSGASVSNFDITAQDVDLVLSGASHLTAVGSSETFIADVSGASVLRSYSFPVDAMRLNVSGASSAHVTANSSLKVIASGASVVRYRGNASVTSDASGASSVRKD